jgi:hypothetical protein
VQIDHGRPRVHALGLNNLRLLAGDIARMNLAELGQFDFAMASQFPARLSVATR